MAEEKQKFVKVKVRVPDRSAQGFSGYYAVQRFWPNGDSEAVIPADKLEELKAEKTFLVVVDEEPASGEGEKSPDSIAKAPQVEPTAEEKAGPGKRLVR